MGAGPFIQSRQLYGNTGGGSGGGGTSDYNGLVHLPTINGVEVSGNKVSGDYGFVSTVEIGRMQSAIEATRQAKLGGSGTEDKVVAIDAAGAVEYVAKTDIGVTSYNDLANIPSIDGTPVVGNKTLVDLGIAPAYSLDLAPTAGSTNMVNSGAVKTALDNKLDSIPIDTSVSASSANLVTNKAVADAIALKQDYLGGAAHKDQFVVVDHGGNVGYSDAADMSGYALKTEVAKEASDRAAADDAITASVTQEVSDRTAADAAIQAQIDGMNAASDVVDVVDTYYTLSSYDTSAVTDKDIIKVLSDTTHADAVSYYRWDVASSAWTYIGSTGPNYTKSEVDALVTAKQGTIGGVSNAGKVVSVDAAGDVAYVDPADIGTKDYGALSSKPSIAGVELSGDKTLAELGVAPEFTVDRTVVQNSTNPVSGGAVFTLHGNLKSDVDAELALKADKSSLAAVATTGRYSDLTGTPLVDATLSPTSANAVENKAVYAALASKLDPSALATVATTGDYKDLSNRPSVDTALNGTSTNAVENRVVVTALNGKAAFSHTHAIADVTDLRREIDSKSPLNHNHNISEVTGLQGLLDAESDARSTTDTSLLNLIDALQTAVGVDDTKIANLEAKRAAR